MAKEIQENPNNSSEKSSRYSLYTEHDNKGVMFHVSTLLPTVVDGTDDQQIEVNNFFLLNNYRFVYII